MLLSAPRKGAVAVVPAPLKAVDRDGARWQAAKLVASNASTQPETNVRTNDSAKKGCAAASGGFACFACMFEFEPARSF